MSELSAEAIKRGLKTDLIGQRIVYYSSLSSANEVLKELAVQGAPEGTLVIANEQTAGKGRLGRKWLAPPGTSLLMALLIKAVSILGSSQFENGQAAGCPGIITAVSVPDTAIDIQISAGCLGSALHLVNIRASPAGAIQETDAH